MRRSAARWSYVVAAVVGLVVGGVLYAQLGPLPLPSNASGPTPSTTASSSPSRPISTPSPSPSPSQTPTTPAPPFTVRALLQPEEFRQYGWGRAEVASTTDWLPDTQLTSCTTLRRSDGDPIAAHTAIYRGLSTTGVEVVVRYESAAVAEQAVKTIRKRIRACATQPPGDPDQSIESLPAPAPDGISSLELWDTTGTDEDAEGFVGLARADDRVAFLTMISLTTDPLVTTNYEALMLQAGRRLV